MFVALTAALLLSAHARPADTAVRATLDDGQVLMGQVRTRTLVLATGSGVLHVPLEDVGEVVPADGEGLAEARGKVTVWLRNGSELRGTWNDPTLQMRIRVGGDDVAVDLPMNDLSRFQLQGGTEWSNGPLYRLRTVFGDDVLVDPSKTTLVVHNDFGTFEPRLSECRSVEPVGAVDGPWRIELDTGTVLLGRLGNDQLTVALPMGPDQVSVQLADFVSLSRDTWGPAVSSTRAISVTQSRGGGGGSPGRRSNRPSAAPSEPWFDRAPLEASKEP